MNILQFLIDIKSRDNGVMRRIGGLQDRLDKADYSARRLSKTMGGVKEAFMSLPGAKFLANPIVAMTAATGTLAKMGMNAGKTATAFNVLTGSVETGSKILGELNRYADTTIYDRTGVQEAAKTMMGFGVAQEKVIGDLKMLGDVAMGDKQRLSQLALVFGQVAAAERLNGQDLLQLINAGYNPLLDISAQTGKSVSKLRDDMSKGLITFEDLRKAFQRATSEGGRFYNMTTEIAKTPFGRYQQTLGDVTGTLLQMYKVIEPLLIPAFDTFSALLKIVQPLVAGLAAAMGWLVKQFRDGNPWIVGIAAAVGAYTAAILVNTYVLKGWRIAELAVFGAMLLVEKAQWLVNAAMTANPIGLIIAGVAALIAVVVTCWNKFAGFRAVILTVWDTVKGFALMIKDFVVARIQELIRGIGTLGEAIGKLFKGDFSGAWEAAKQGTRDLVGVDSKRAAFTRARDLVTGGSEVYRSHLQREEAKQRAKETISDPSAAAGEAAGGTGTSLTPSGESTSKRNEAITTGGTRNTSITVNIAKFFDSINVSMTDRMDTAELQKTILECMNRALEISYSAAR